MTALADVMPAAPDSPTNPIGLCLDCGYSLVGLPTPRCPECGREFDPMDPSTMNMGRELSELAQWVLGPLRWPVNLVSWGALAYALWEARLPGEQIATSISLYVLIALGVFWLGWPVVRYLAAGKYGWPYSLLMRGQKQRVLVGVCLLLSAAAIARGLPLRAALYWSRPAMDRLAADAAASTDTYLDDRRVGVFYARRIKQLPDRVGVRFTVEESKRAYRSGFIYLPNTDPKKVGWRNRSYRYIGDHWWAWREEG